MNNDMFLPLRLIVTTDCNGKCDFCHKEGANSNQDMPFSLILKCANIASNLAIPVTITGGEPTLRKDLGIILDEIKNIDTHIKLGLTTNGVNLFKHNSVKSTIDTLNLSIISFDNMIAKNFQNVNPQKAIEGFLSFPAKNKNLNVVVLEDNYFEVLNFIEFCIKYNCNLDLMFELKKTTPKEKMIQKYIFDLVEKMGKVSLILKPSPVLVISIASSIKIRIKHPFLSALPRFDYCNECVYIKNCYERICALRIYPNGRISPCLKREIIERDIGIEKQIYEIQKSISKGTSLLSFISNDCLTSGLKGL